MTSSAQNLESEAPTAPSGRRRAHRIVMLPLLVLFGMLIAACGSASSPSTTSTSAPATNTSGASTGTTGTTASTSTTAAPATTAPAVAIGAGSQFCNFAANAAKSESATAAAAAGSSSATSLKATYAKLQAEEPQILNAAPAAIKGDFQTLFTFVNQFYSELAKVNYNYAKIPSTFTASLAANETKVAAASTAITSYLSKTCGISSTTPTT